MAHNAKNRSRFACFHLLIHGRNSLQQQPDPASGVVTAWIMYPAVWVALEKFGTNTYSPPDILTPVDTALASNMADPVIVISKAVAIKIAIVFFVFIMAIPLYRLLLFFTNGARRTSS